MKYDVRVIKNVEYGPREESFNGCEVRETLQYLELIPDHADKKRRFIFPWGIIVRALIEEAGE